MKCDNWQYFSVKRFPCNDIFLSVHFCFHTSQMKMKKEKNHFLYRIDMHLGQERCTA